MHSDLIIIGAGPGGYETALTAAKCGLSVTIIVSLFKEGDKFGIDDFSFSVDFNAIMSRKNGVVEQLREGILSMFKAAKVNYVNATAEFKDSKTVVANGEEYTADNIIIATGSTSRSLPIPGADEPFVMDSTDMLSIDHVPESLTIIGGGVIGMEFAAIFNSLGSKVTVIEFMKQILPPFDSDIAKRLKQALSKKGINIITSAAAKKIEQNSEYEITVTYECKGKEETVVSTDLLMAVGRAPRVQGLNLEAAGVEYTPKGIQVDDWMRNFERDMDADRSRIQRLKEKVLTPGELYMIIGMLTALRVSHDSADKRLASQVDTYPLNQGQISVFTEELLKLSLEQPRITAWDVYNVATEIYKPGKTDFPAMIPQNGAMADFLLSYNQN